MQSPRKQRRWFRRFTILWVVSVVVCCASCWLWQNLTLYVEFYAANTPGVRNEFAHWSVNIEAGWLHMTAHRQNSYAWYELNWRGVNVFQKKIEFPEQRRQDAAPY